MKTSDLPGMRAPLFRFADRYPGKFKGLPAQLIDGGAQGAGDPADADADSQLQGAHPPAQIEEKFGDLPQIGGDGLKLVSGSDGVGQANPPFPEMGGGDKAKPGAEHGTQAAGAAGADYVGNDNCPELFVHMHTPVQFCNIAHLCGIDTFLRMPDKLRVNICKISNPCPPSF